VSTLVRLGWGWGWMICCGKSCSMIRLFTGLVLCGSAALVLVYRRVEPGRADQTPKMGSKSTATATVSRLKDDLLDGPRRRGVCPRFTIGHTRPTRRACSSGNSGSIIYRPPNQSTDDIPSLRGVRIESHA
jgi:hypothetical protein